MERTEILKKLSEFMAEMVYGELKAFKFSTQDIIELYCEVRKQEDDLAEKAKAMVKTQLVETRLKNFKSLRKILVDTYEAITNEDAAPAKLERWYGRFKEAQKLNQPPTTKVRIMNSSSVMSPTKASHLVGLPKSKAFLATNAVLTKEGFWRGKAETTSLNEDQLRYFYYILRLDEEILMLMSNNRTVYVNVNDRLHGLVVNRGRIEELLKRQFGLEAESGFQNWKNAICAVFPQAEKLALAVTIARTEPGITEAYNRLVKFWNGFGIKVKDSSESERFLNLTVENFSAEPGIIVPEPYPALMQVLARLNEEAEEQRILDIQMIRDLIKEHNCHSVVLQAKDYGLLFGKIRHLLRGRIVIAAPQKEGICLFTKNL